MFICPECCFSCEAGVSLCPSCGLKFIKMDIDFISFQKFYNQLKAKSYYIQKRIYKGTISSIYLAKQRSAENKNVKKLEKKIVIKAINLNHIHNTQMLDSFKREMKIISSLEHENIISVFDLNYDKPIPYFVMNYRSGATLASFLKTQKKLALTEAISICIKILNSLQLVHKQNYIHCDITPGNILLSNNLNPVLIDFGICRTNNFSTSIHHSFIPGTASYMSPEQCEDSIVIDRRSDIYSVGIILFELLSGSPPYVSDSPFQTMQMQITKKLPELNKAIAHPVILNQIKKILEKACHKQKKKRFQNVNEFSKELKRLASNAGGFPKMKIDNFFSL